MTNDQQAMELARQLGAELARAIENFQTIAEQNRLLRIAVQAFLDCEGIPPTRQFRYAHQMALAAMRAAGQQPPGFVGEIKA